MRTSQLCRLLPKHHRFLHRGVILEPGYSGRGRVWEHHSVGECESGMLRTDRRLIPGESFYHNAFVVKG